MYILLGHWGSVFFLFFSFCETQSVHLSFDVRKTGSDRIFFFLNILAIHIGFLLTLLSSLKSEAFLLDKRAGVALAGASL